MEKGHENVIQREKPLQRFSTYPNLNSSYRLIMWRAEKGVVQLNNQCIFLFYNIAFNYINGLPDYTNDEI